MGYQSDLSLDAIDVDTSKFTKEELEEYNQCFVENWDQLVASLSNMIDRERMQDVVQYAYLVGLHRNIPSNTHTSMKNNIFSCVKTVGIKYKTDKYEGGMSKYCNIEIENKEGDNVTVLDMQEGSNNDGEKVGIQPSKWQEFTNELSPEAKAIKQENDEEFARKVKCALQFLSEGEKIAVIQTAVLGKSYKKVASEFDMSVSNVSSLRLKGIKKLKGHLS